MSDLTPITREEKLLDGENLTPITRKEQFIKRIYDKTQEIPEPITREEMFLKKAGEGGGGDVTIEQLNVTQNGTYSEEGKAFSPVIVEVPQPTMTTLNVTENRTYTAPSGTAYNEVDVDVPLPSNAYLLKELSNLPQPIASFSDGSDNPLKSLTASIVPVQSGSGDPSPENVRPISGWSGVDIWTDGVNLIPNGTDASNGYIANRYLKNDNTTGGSDATFHGYVSEYFLLKAGKYILTNSGVGNAPSICFYDILTKTFIKGIQYSSRESILLDLPYDIYARCSVVNTRNFQLQRGEVSSEYEDYNGRTYTIPFTDSQGNPVEVYGGSVDVVNGGEQPNPYNMIDLSTLNWSKSGTGNKFVATLSDAVRFPTSSSTSIANLICSNYKTVSGKDCYDATNNYAIGGAYYNNTNRLIVNDIDKYNTMTAEEFTTAMQGVQLCYELATPTTFYTQPTSIKSLDGENNVFASTGDVEELKYFSKEV